MRHRKTGKILDRKQGPRKALLRGLVNSLVLYEKIKTTKAKAKAIKPIVEKYVTIGKTPSLHHKRLLKSELYTEGAIRKVFEVLGPRFKDRKGGYTRIINLGPRQGDGAEIVQIEFVS
ncbi:MAG: 50S ribosomal protein L17 [Patescibacteria group bacterium]